MNSFASKFASSCFETGASNPCSLDDMFRDLATASVVLFGEVHGNSAVHEFELCAAERLFALKGKNLALGGEMFEADDQLVLDEYLSGLIEHKHLIAEAKIWSNYETDYRRLVDFARERGLMFVASNCPRRYANIVAKKGLNVLETISEEGKKSLAPLPIAVDLSTPGYEAMTGMGPVHDGAMTPGNFVAAQAVKDATMAHFILKNLPPDGSLLHFNGDYHSRNRGGIYWHLKRARPDLVVKTISCVGGETPRPACVGKDAADFLLILP